MARKIIVANWKMNLGGKDGVLFAQALFKELEYHGFAGETSPKQIILCPPITVVNSLVKLSAKTGISIGAQNCGANSCGPFTGEIGATMIKDWGAEYVILGHSERRTQFHETNEDISLKVQQAVSVGLIPILCVGETLKEKEQGKTEAVIEKQLKEGLALVNRSTVIIAYEPVWAIGTGKTPSQDDIEKIHSLIHQLHPDCPILYGGSVNERNAREITSLPHVNGVLVGSASLKATTFMSLLKNIADC